MSRVKDNLYGGRRSSTGDSGETGAENVIISETQPDAVAVPSIWLDTTNGENILKIYDGTKWIVVSGVWA